MARRIATFLVDFFSFILALVTLALMTRIPPPPIIVKQSNWSLIKLGVHYAFSRQVLVGTYLTDFIAMFSGMPKALFPAIALSFGGAKALGLLYAAPAIGALIMSFFSGWIKSVKRKGMAIAITTSLWGLAIVFFGFAHQLKTALLFLVLAGALDVINGIFRSIMWNEIIPNEYRGRLAGIEMISYASGPKLGDAKAGFMAAIFGITTTIISGGILCIHGIATCYYFMPKFRNYNSS